MTETFITIGFWFNTQKRQKQINKYKQKRQNTDKNTRDFDIHTYKKGIQTMEEKK